MSAGWQEIVTGALFFTVSAGLVFTLAALGELVQEKAGVLNLGLEAVFIAGALGGFYTAFRFDNLWLGYVGGALFGMIVGVVFGVLVVSLKLDQVVVGILLVALALAAADVVWDRLFGQAPAPPGVDTATRLSLPLLSKIPVVGPALFSRIVAEYLVVGVVVLVSWLLFHTRSGLVARGVGEFPEALHFSGHNVNLLRFVAVLFDCSLTGLGGALLTVGQLGLYAPGVTAGRGWIAIAIVIMGAWRPWRTLLAAFVFGGAVMLQFEVQAAGIDIVPFEFLVAFPYLVVVLALLVRRTSISPPAALGVPFRRP